MSTHPFHMTYSLSEMCTDCLSKGCLVIKRKGQYTPTLVVHSNEQRAENCATGYQERGRERSRNEERNEFLILRLPLPTL